MTTMTAAAACFARRQLVRSDTLSSSRWSIAGLWRFHCLLCRNADSSISPVVARRRPPCAHHPLPNIIHHHNINNNNNTINNNNNTIVRTLAGHNKWSQIRHKKAIKDVRRAKALAKASRAIIMASRACGGEVSDLRLQSALAHAQSVQLPKERIQEAIQQHQHQKNSSHTELESHRYDAMIQAGTNTKVACVILAVTDNHKRAAAQVRAAISKIGGDMLPSGALDFMFQYCGVILVERQPSPSHNTNVTTPSTTTPPTANHHHAKTSNAMSHTNHATVGLHDDDGNDDQQLWECAIEHGATNLDYDPTTQTTMITCEPTDLWSLVTALRNNNNNQLQLQQPQEKQPSLPLFNEQQQQQQLPLPQQQNTTHYNNQVVTEFEHRYMVVDPESMMVDLTHNATAQEKLEQFLDIMEENDDVTNVYHNAMVKNDDDDDDDDEAASSEILKATTITTARTTLS